MIRLRRYFLRVIYASHVIRLRRYSLVIRSLRSRYFPPCGIIPELLLNNNRTSIELSLALFLQSYYPIGLINECSFFTQDHQKILFDLK